MVDWSLVVDWKEAPSDLSAPQDGVPLDSHARLPIILIVEDTPEHAAVIQAALAYRSVKAAFRVVTSGEEAMSLEASGPTTTDIGTHCPLLLCSTTGYRRSRGSIF